MKDASLGRSGHRALELYAMNLADATSPQEIFRIPGSGGVGREEKLKLSLLPILQPRLNALSNKLAKSILPEELRKLLSEFAVT